MSGLGRGWMHRCRREATGIRMRPHVLRDALTDGSTFYGIRLIRPSFSWIVYSGAGCFPESEIDQAQQMSCHQLTIVEVYIPLEVAGETIANFASLLCVPNNIAIELLFSHDVTAQSRFQQLTALIKRDETSRRLRCLPAKLC